MPFKDLVKTIHEKNWMVEDREIRNYYDHLGKIDFTSQEPFALFEYNGTNFKYIFENSQCRILLQNLGYKTDAELLKMMNSRTDVVRI